MERKRKKRIGDWTFSVSKVRREEQQKELDRKNKTGDWFNPVKVEVVKQPLKMQRFPVKRIALALLTLVTLSNPSFAMYGGFSEQDNDPYGFNELGGTYERANTWLDNQNAKLDSRLEAFKYGSEGIVRSRYPDSYKRNWRGEEQW